jgi:uncharacterized protein YjbJ (UPF0337 family)
MNTDIAEGKWKQMKGKIQKQWGKLTDDDVDRVKGQRKEFVGLMQERYGKNRDEAEREFEKFRNANP